jgi:hypothetical protein
MPQPLSGARSAAGCHSHYPGHGLRQDATATIRGTVCGRMPQPLSGHGLRQDATATIRARSAAGCHSHYPGHGAWSLYTSLGLPLDLRSPSWSRSDRMMVAVGFNPRFTASHEGSRRGATPETTLPFGTRPHQASRRDATFISPLEPWVETHGYPPGSLRDLGKPTRAEHEARNRSPELCIKTRLGAGEWIQEIMGASAATWQFPCATARTVGHRGG